MPRSRDGAVAVVTGYGLHVRGFESRQRQDFSLLQIAYTGSGAYPTFYLRAAWGYFSGGKSCRSVKATPTSVEVNNTDLYAFKGLALNKLNTATTFNFKFT
jgi:hypothetical protein